MKYYGTVGYAVTAEKQDQPGVWEDTITERFYYGEVIKLYSKWQNSGNLNDNLTIGNAISILADAFAIQNFSLIKYVTLEGVKWKVTNVEVQRPRLILTLGGEYNG